MDQPTPSAVVFRHGTVLTMDDTHRVLTDADVLVVGDRVAEVGTGLTAPDGALEVDASGGIVMPGMIDTHRHMWQTAMRGYGADWTLTQYFVWYYLEHGRRFRPEDMRAGNLLAAWEALDAGVTTVVDWSHGLQSVDHAEAAVDGLRSHARPVRAGVRQHPGRAVGVDGPARGAAVPHEPARRQGRPPRCAARLRRDRRPGLPGEGRLRGGPRARAAGDDARGRLGCDERRRDPAHARARVHDAPDDVRPRRDARHRLVPANRGDRWLRLGGDGVRAERGPGIPAHLAGAPVRHPGLAVDGHQCLVERRPVHGDADDTRRGPGPRAPRGPRRRRDRHRTRTCAPSTSSTGRPAAAPGTSVGTTSAGSPPAPRPTSCSSRTITHPCRSRC